MVSFSIAFCYYKSENWTLKPHLLRYLACFLLLIIKESIQLLFFELETYIGLYYFVLNFYQIKRMMKFEFVTAWLSRL
jgi:hypothetical protein